MTLNFLNFSLCQWQAASKESNRNTTKHSSVAFCIWPTLYESHYALTAQTFKRVVEVVE